MISFWLAWQLNPFVGISHAPKAEGAESEQANHGKRGTNRIGNEQINNIRKTKGKLTAQPSSSYVLFLFFRASTRFLPRPLVNCRPASTSSKSSTEIRTISTSAVFENTFNNLNQYLLHDIALNANRGPGEERVAAAERRKRFITIVLLIVVRQCAVKADTNLNRIEIESAERWKAKECYEIEISCFISLIQLFIIIDINNLLFVIR